MDFLRTNIPFVGDQSEGPVLDLNRHDIFLCTLGAVLIAIVAALDMFYASGVIVSLGYAAVVALGMGARRNSVALLLATLGTFASAAAVIIDLEEFAATVEIANRCLVLVAIWGVAALVCTAHRAPSSAATAREFMEAGDIFQAVFNQTFQFVAALDSDGKIIEANQTLRDYAGLSSGEIRSTNIWLLPNFVNDPAAQERLQEAVKSAADGDFVRDEFVVYGIGDRRTIIDLSLKPIRGQNGSGYRMIMEARDITEVRLQHEMLVQAQKMEAVGELTAGVAHDFNNLLTVIVGNLELLENRIEGNGDVRDRLARAIKAAFKGQALTQQLLAFSRRQALSPVVIDVNTLLRGMKQMYEALGENIEIAFELADDLPLSEVDSTLLETALLNIAINARDAMPDGGTLRFQTALTVMESAYHGEVADLPPGDYICMAISDTGEGMSEPTVAQVFDPFFSTKPEGQGTGLGLSMVYGFIKQSGGDVKIYSELGKGTTIRIYLPTTDKTLPKMEREAEKDELAPVEGKSVLLADDDETVRDVIYSVLTEIGCNVDAVESGDAAIERLRAGNTYDLIFTDMVMVGDSSGTDVAHAARAILPEVPIIFCSGFPRTTLAEQAPVIDGALFIGKPLQQVDLIAIVQRAFAQSARSVQ